MTQLNTNVPQHGAAYRVMWQTDHMPGPAFEYFRKRADAEAFARRIRGET